MPDRPLNASSESAALHPDDTRAGVLLAMLHGARDRGDRPEAERAWRLIAQAELERVRGIVRGFQNSALPGGRIPAADVDDVAADVFVRLHAQSDVLRGRSVGELRLFMRAATGFTCRDYVREYVAEAQHRGPSLVDGGQASASRDASDRALARLAEQLAADDDEAEIARAIIHPALALVDDDKRGVLVMTEAGYSVEEMMERFGLSRDSVYQRRRRALMQLGDGIRELAGEDEGE